MIFPLALVLHGLVACADLQALAMSVHGTYEIVAGSRMGRAARGLERGGAATSGT